MGITKVRKLLERLFFLYLVLFPFGQLLRWDMQYQGYRITVIPTDFVAFLIFIIYITKIRVYPKIARYLAGFYLSLLFSSIVFWALYPQKEIIIGFLYLFRLIVYSGLLFIVWYLVKEKIISRENVINSLLVITVYTAIFGWFQYFIFPDLRSLITIGWDDHLYRLVGSFLDPAYTGIILVLGTLLSLDKLFYRFYSNNENLLCHSRESGNPGFSACYLYRFPIRSGMTRYKTTITNIVTVIFLVITIAFTYSRASYLSLIIGVITLLAAYKKRLLVFVPVLLFAFCLLLYLLPRPSSSGVQLERLYSVRSRFVNYQETFDIIKSSPLLGVGYNNLCLTRKLLFDNQSAWNSHSCSGSDNGFLFLLAIGGVIGMISLIRVIGLIIEKTRKIPVIIASMATLFIHSLFTNSLFYPWILGYFSILIGSYCIERSGRKADVN